MSRLARWVAMTTVLVAGATAAPAPAEDAVLAPVAGVGKAGTHYRVTVSSAPIILGKRKRVTLLVEAPEAPGPLRPLDASVNVGVILKVARQTPGRYQIIYQLPTQRFPQVAILALWRETGLDASIAFFRIPLLGRAKIPIDAAPGATVVATVGGVEAPPVTANARGKVVLNLVVPPGETEARLRMKLAGQPDRAGVYPIKVPPFNRLTLAVVPHAVPADGKSKARILAYYDPVGGRRLNPKALQLRASVGRLTQVAGRGNLLTAGWTAPPRGTKARRVDFQATARSDSRSHARASVRLGTPAAQQILISTEPAQLLGDGQEALTVSLTVLDGDGIGVDGLPMKVRVEAPGKGGLAGALEALGKGKFRFQITPILYRSSRKIIPAKISVQAGDLVVEHRVRVEPWVPVELQVIPGRVDLIADGQTRASLQVTVFDARGRAMRGLEVQVNATHGALDFTPKERSDGVRVVGYLPPQIETTSFTTQTEATRVHGMITVRVEALETTVPLTLTPVTRVLAGARSYLEVSGGYGSNLGVLRGPRARLSAGTRVLARGRFSLEAGAFLGGSLTASALSWTEGQGGGDGWMRLIEGQGGAEIRLAVLGAWWRLEAIGAGGVGVLHLRSAWAGADPLQVTRLAPAVEGRLAFGLRLGPGRVVLGAVYARRLLGAPQTPPTRGLALEGNAGGLSGTLGYRLEL